MMFLVTHQGSSTLPLYLYTTLYLCQGTSDQFLADKIY